MMDNPTKFPTNAALVQETAAVPGEVKSEDVIGTGFSGIVAFVREFFNNSKHQRMTHESRWLNAYRNYRGIYDPKMAFREGEVSKVFVKITKTKVMAAYGQIQEVLFATGKFPIGVEPTPVPEGVAEYAHIPAAGQQAPEQAGPVDPYGYEGDGKDVAPGTGLSDLLGGLKDEYGKAGFVEGPAKDGKSPQISPAKMTAANMQKVILDQLAESKATPEISSTVFEMVLLGTGCLKGPFTVDKIVNRWVYQNPDQGESVLHPEDTEFTEEAHEMEGNYVYMPTKTKAPKIKHVSIWNIYPDPNATFSNGVEKLVERQALTRSEMRKLLDQPFFRAEAISGAISDGPNYVREWFETFLDDANFQQMAMDRYEVLEYWGKIDKQTVEAATFPLDALGLDVLDDFDEADVNIWICGNHLLRMVINPFKPTRLPYLICPYEINPYQVFGVGVPENMEDSQMVMNGHVRMAIDNMALAGHMVFDIDETALVDGQDMKIYPGKIFRRQSGQPGTAVHGIKFPDTMQSNLAMFDKFRQLSDEATGIPSYSHGQTGVSSTTRTAAGMSMLMGAAALNIKTVVKNIDEFLLRPLGEGLFAWNMQFNKDMPEIRGDFDVVAKGTTSLMAKEIKTQRLLTFAQVASNPMLAPFVKWHKILGEVAVSMELDDKEIVNNPEEAAIQAKLLGSMNALTQAPSPNGGTGMGSPQGISDQPAAIDASGRGGGNIGTGTVPTPGEAGFSGSVAQPAG